MKKEAVTKLKFMQLKRRLRLPLWQAMGLLESLWRATEANAPAGDIGKLTDDEIAAAIEWEGDAAEMIAALVEFRWLNRDDGFRLYVNDWSIHCPNHLKGGFARVGKLFADQAVAARDVISPDGSKPVPKLAHGTLNGQLSSQLLATQPPNLTQPDLTQPNHTSPGTGPQVGRSVGRLWENTWAAVREHLVEAGVERPVEAQRGIEANGCDPDHAHALIRFAEIQGKGPGAIVHRFKNATPSMPLNRGWANGEHPEQKQRQVSDAEKVKRAKADREQNDSRATALIKECRRKGITTDEGLKAELAKAGLEWPK